MVTYNMPRNSVKSHMFMRSSDGNAIYYMCPIKNMVIMYHEDERDLARKQKTCPFCNMETHQDNFNK